MIRVFLTAEDLLRTRFASHPAPLIEVGHALAAMHRQSQPGAAGAAGLRRSCPGRPARCLS